MTKTRRRFKQATSLRERLARFAAEVRQEAECAPAGHEKDQMLMRAERAELAADIAEWSARPGLTFPGLVESPDH
jgi:hypothetical protein